MKKIGKHDIIMVRFDSSTNEDIACFECVNDIVMEVSLPSDNILKISDSEKEYIHIKGDGIFTAHVHSSTLNDISIFVAEKQ